jgi:hypothetical protein
LNSLDFNDSLSNRVLDLEDQFNEDTEYKLMRILEIKEKDWRVDDFDIGRTDDNLLWQGEIRKNKANGYGW